jgi:ATP-dependent 26S proteasome regulatory subunit
MLDSALANRPSRFDVLVEFKLPDVEARKGLIKLFSKNMAIEFKLNELDSISASMKDLTGAQMKEAFVYAQLKAIQGNIPIDMKDVLKRAEDYKKINPAEAYRE